MQGRFKQNLSFDTVLTGQTFAAPFQNLPTNFLIKIVFSFLRSIAPGLQADVLCDRPYLLTPLIAAAQTVHVATSMETAPSLESIVQRTIEDVEIEDTTLIGPSYKARNMDASQRRKYFKNSRNRQSGEAGEELKGNGSQSTTKTANAYNSNFIWTFGFWQDLFDPSDYNAHLPFGSYDVSQYLDHQPMRIKAQVGVDGESLWDVQLWHTKLIREDA